MNDPIQEQLVTARRNQILDASAIVFAEKGFHATTIRDIARRANIADGTIYNYFDSKPALLLGIFERIKLRVMEDDGTITLPLPEDLDVQAFLSIFFHQPLLALKADNFGLFRVIISEIAVNEELRRLYYDQILLPSLNAPEAWLKQYAVKSGIEPEEAALRAGLTVRALSGMVMGLMLENILGDPLLDEHWERMPALLTNLVLNGLKYPVA